ncbi:MAG: DNA repair protein RecO [Candidatus Andersenbacteria bacterium RIFCSPHIGHO2_12_FULL_46_9]|nr:MAG: DNA repair protein RecO [Candidatus Andersenbacteria bacterium RIFCSPHIGHO2_02_FULL_46_16]OGY36358.1 MAG: DNA repair protein RecO [Candidatus Andersenbacteria bacterium RIFCSPHIGHO2_12_FULL_46_9]OGY37851.1 MAG: DNA repair protein RecO [Candidatus Andersenbacteria bacterium RIFCSPLOWO2_02_FULL_46_11]OGY41236.1 MAG: DNA repair protein RecO [Candidatus Andersenbacteria bacterium RIFCSPLOWO2_12_FULL_45_8]HBE89701.1 DNA repair protein RecO [Candidatus Andersenbacteria bacterium]
MIKREKIEGLVLSRRNIGEADRILTLFTANRGLITVMAKGVRVVPSRRGSHVEPFTEILTIVNGTNGRYWLTAAETKEYFQELHQDQNGLMRAHFLARAVTGLFHQEEPQPQIYEAVRDSWKIWPSCKDGQGSMLEISLYLMILKAAGYQPQLKSCRVCGLRVGETIVLDENLGGWACISCRSSLAEAIDSITMDGLRVIKYLAEKPNLALRLSIDIGLGQQLEEAMRKYVSGVVDAQWRGALVKDLR